MENSILETRDYSLFKRLAGNRDLDIRNLDAIRASMRKKYLRNPIKVNENMEIIDGQHRFEAAKSLQLPIFYFIDKGCGISEVQQHNSISKKWALCDFLNLYCTEKRPQYEQFRRLVHIYTDFPMPVLIRIFALRAAMSRTEQNGVFTYDFPAGTYRIVDIEKSKQVILMLYAFKDYTKIGGLAFVQAFLSICFHRNYKHEQMMGKLQICGSLLKGCTKTSVFRDALVLIYNYKRQTKIDLTPER